MATISSGSRVDGTANEDEESRMKLLIGIDGEDGGRDALELARVLAGDGASSQAVAVAVVQPGPLPTAFALLTEPEALECAPQLAEARERLVGFETEFQAYGGGSPAGILTTLAEAEPYDAIVVGSPHRGPIGRMVLGSVAASLLNGAPTAVAVAPRGFAQAEPGPLRRIAVGYDGSPEAKLALARAERLARAANATIEVLTVLAPPVPAPVPVPAAGTYLPASPQAPDRVLAEAINSVDQDLAVEGRCLDGPPAMTLASACADGIDLLVVGSRGYGPVSRVLLGSTSHELLTTAACPLLVVPRP